MSTLSDDERDEILHEFDDVVNLSPSQLEEWLETEESRSVGEADGGGESKGHASGRRIVSLQRTNKDDYDDADYEHMRTVVGYVHRHLAQRPSGDVEDSDWRHSLMNWGHDPLE